MKKIEWVFLLVLFIIPTAAVRVFAAAGMVNAADETGCTISFDEENSCINAGNVIFRLDGSVLPEGWGRDARRVDFYDIKGDLEALLAPLPARFEKAAHPALHPGRSARIVLDEQEIGCIGELHPEWVQKYELPQAPVLFELDLAAVKAARLPAYAEVSRFPPVIRDLAVVVDQSLELQRLLDGLQSHLPGLVQDVQLFDVYAGKGVPENKKSLALRIVMQDTQRTLQDSEVDAAMQQLMAYLEQSFAAQLRA